MTPWKSTKYLYQNKDFENYEFRSPVNVWKPQKKYLHEMDKVKFLEFEVLEGHMLFIPPYWWYSIKFMEPLSSVCVFKYRTYMNTVAILPKLCMKTLQRQNTKREIVKKVRFQKNEFNDKEKDKGIIKNPITATTATTANNIVQQQLQQQLQQSNDSSVVEPQVVPANFESSSLDSNAVASEEDVKESHDAITLSLVE
jgi:hypothetical protein